MSRDNYSTPPGIRIRKPMAWGPWASLAAALGLLAIMVVSECRAQGSKEYDTPRTHQLWVCAGASSCKPEGEPKNSTACALDLAAKANTMPKGTRLYCERVKP